MKEKVRKENILEELSNTANGCAGYEPVYEVDEVGVFEWYQEDVEELEKENHLIISVDDIGHSASITKKGVMLAGTRSRIMFEPRQAWCGCGIKGLDTDDDDSVYCPTCGCVAWCKKDGWDKDVVEINIEKGIAKQAVEELYKEKYAVVTREGDAITAVKDTQRDVIFECGEVYYTGEGDEYRIHGFTAVGDAMVHNYCGENKKIELDLLEADDPALDVFFK